MKLQNNLIFLSFILFISCSKVNIENENKTMMQGLKETFIKNKKIVLEKEYYASEKLAREIPIKDGLINGEVKDYYENGKIRSTTNFVNGDIDGVIKEYNQAGKVIKETLYKNGKKVK